MLGWIHATSLWVKPVNQQPNPLSNVLMKNQSNSLQQQAHTLDSMATHYIPYHRLSIQNWQGWNGKLILLFFSFFWLHLLDFLVSNQHFIPLFAPKWMKRATCWCEYWTMSSRSWSFFSMSWRIISLLWRMFSADCWLTLGTFFFSLEGKTKQSGEVKHTQRVN